MGCIVFGNRFTQKLAYEEVSRAGGRLNEALIKSILEKSWEEDGIGEPGEQSLPKRYQER